MSKQSYVVSVEEVEIRPTDWTNCKTWPNKGFFKVKGESDLYRVTDYSVDYIGMCDKDVFTKPIDEAALNPPITEDLFLKAISAAANSKLLSA